MHDLFIHHLTADIDMFFYLILSSLFYGFCVVCIAWPDAFSKQKFWTSIVGVQFRKAIFPWSLYLFIIIPFSTLVSFRSISLTIFNLAFSIIFVVCSLPFWTLLKGRIINDLSLLLYAIVFLFSSTLAFYETGMFGLINDPKSIVTQDQYFYNLDSNTFATRLCIITDNTAHPYAKKSSDFRPPAKNYDKNAPVVASPPYKIPANAKPDPECNAIHGFTKSNIRWFWYYVLYFPSKETLDEVSFCIRNRSICDTWYRLHPKFGYP